jgi:hypothetical protein
MPLPSEVVQQIVTKTDGIPLFVEELVKTILESGLVREEAGRYVLTGPLPPLTIPTTLQDALTARLDRLAPVKELAQVGVVLGREFSYEVLRAVAPLDDATLQQALQPSANPEAVQHLTKSLELLATLPETPARVQQELDLQLTLGPALSATKGSVAPEVEQTYIRARALCAQIGETPQLFRTLRGLCRFYTSRGALPMAREPGEQLLRLAQRQDAPTPGLEAHEALGNLLFYLGEYAAARTHLEQGIVLTDPAVQRAQALRHGIAPGVTCLGIAAHTLWCLGYPVQAVRRSQEALALAQAFAHPSSLAIARHWAAWLHQRRRDVPVVREQAGAPHWTPRRFLRGYLHPRLCRLRGLLRL